MHLSRNEYPDTMWSGSQNRQKDSEEVLTKRGTRTLGVSEVDVINSFARAASL